MCRSPTATQHVVDEVSDWVARIFDDDLDSGNGDDGAFDHGGAFGAGPRPQLSGGVGDPSINAGQHLATSDPPVYKPVRSDSIGGLELNLGNEPWGDMVAGEYDVAASHVEDAAYNRPDFVAATSPETAFLVRMRRTNDAAGLDAIPGVSSDGSALPYLFGRGRDSRQALRPPATRRVSKASQCARRALRCKCQPSRSDFPTT